MPTFRDSKRALAERCLGEPSLDLTVDERSFLEEFLRRYPDDPTLTPVDRRRLVRALALLAGRLPHEPVEDH